MTSRNRITAAFEHHAPDRTPMFEYVLLPPVADHILRRPCITWHTRKRWAQYVTENGWKKAVEQAACDQLQLARILGHDMLYVTPCPPPPVPPPAPGKASNIPEPVNDPVEAVRQRNDRATAFPPLTQEDTLTAYTVLRNSMASADLDLPILAPAYRHGIWTDVDLMQTMLLAPDVAHRHFELATRNALAQIQKYSELGLDMVGVGGDFAGNRPLISPELYRTFIMPEVRKISDAVHRRGMRAVNASDGDLWSVADDFLIGCGVDGYLEIDKGAGMDLRRLKAAYGDRITFLGNMDCGNELSFASEDSIRRATHECLENGLGNGGHIFCASNAITESIPLGNYLTMVNSYREFFALPDVSLD